MQRHWFLVLALFGPVTAAAQDAAPANSRQFSAERMWALKRLGDPAITPDGKLAVVPVTTYDIAENKGLTDLWLVPLNGGGARQLTSDKASDTQATVSPDGEWVAFVSKRGEDTENQIYVIAIDGGEARRVTNLPTGASLPKWFAGQQAHRLRQPGMAGPGALGRPGGAQEGTRVIEDDRAHLDARTDLALRSLPRRPAAASVLDFHRRRRADRDHAHVGILALAGRSRLLGLRHLPRRSRGRVRRRCRSQRHRPQLRHHSAAHLRLQAGTQHHRGEQGRRRRSRSTVPTAAASPSRSGASRGSTPTAHA